MLKGSEPFSAKLYMDYFSITSVKGLALNTADRTTNKVTMHLYMRSCSIVSLNKSRHKVPKPQHLHRQIVMANITKHIFKSPVK